MEWEYTCQARDLLDCVSFVALMKGLLVCRWYQPRSHSRPLTNPPPRSEEKSSTCVLFCRATTFVHECRQHAGVLPLSRQNVAPGAGESSARASLRGEREEEREWRGGTVLVRACWSQCVATSVEVLWFHQPRLRSVRPGAPSHILWYVLLPPPNPSPFPGSPDYARCSHRQEHAAVVVSHVSSSTSSGWFHLWFFLRWSRTFGLLCSRWRLRRSNKAGEAACKTFKGTVRQISYRALCHLC